MCVFRYSNMKSDSKVVMIKIILPLISITDSVMRLIREPDAELVLDTQMNDRKLKSR